MYLGNQVARFNVSDPENPGKECWLMLSDLYVKQAVAEVETMLVTTLKQKHPCRCHLVINLK
jgi:hypothetical protein